MKFLENAKLEALTSALSVDCSDCKIDARVESYSCKMVQSDKKLYKELFPPGTSPNERQPLSPPTCETPWLFPPPGSDRLRHRSRSSNSASDNEPEQVLCDSVSRKTLFDLTTLLNASFPDYDFSDAKGEDFHRIPSLEEAVSSIDNQMSAVIHSYSAQLRHGVWTLIDDEIKLKECQIYSYKPDYQSDPFAEEGCIWSFNYIFSNKRLKRMLFFACRAQTSSIRDSQDSFDDQIWDMDE